MFVKKKSQIEKKIMVLFWSSMPRIPISYESSLARPLSLNPDDLLFQNH